VSPVSVLRSPSPSPSPSPANQAYVRALEARLLLRAGKSDLAARWALGADSEAYESFYSSMASAVFRAEILAQSEVAHERAVAADIVAGALPLARRAHQNRMLMHFRAIEAVIHAADGDEAAAMSALAEALAIAERGGCVRTFIDLGPRMQTLLALVKECDDHWGCAHRIREAFLSEPPRPTTKARDSLPDPLTERELEILTLLARRLSNKEIASRLFVSVATIKTHASTVYQKLHVHDRRAAVERASALGLLDRA
jgi:ATP/maltotriose-dependent transcriptional regulator MalT